MKTKIVTCANDAPKEAYLLFDKFMSTSNQFGFSPIVLGWGKPWTGLGSKPKMLLEAIESGMLDDCDRIIFCDAFDVFFVRSPEEIFEATKEQNKIIFNAEINCFPDSSLADEHPPSTTRFQYLNSGFSVGPVEMYLGALLEMGAKFIPDDYQKPDGSWVHSNDQGDWMLQFLKGSINMGLDSDVKLCMATFNATQEEFDTFSPVAYHLNGPAKTEPLTKIILNKFFA